MLKPTWIQKTISKGFGGKQINTNAVSVELDHADVHMHLRIMIFARLTTVTLLVNIVVCTSIIQCKLLL